MKLKRIGVDLAKNVFQIHAGTATSRFIDLRCLFAPQLQARLVQHNLMIQ
jgi:hypothetical protein